MLILLLPNRTNKQIPSSILWRIGCAKLHLASNKLRLLFGGWRAPVEQVQVIFFYFILFFSLKWDISSHFKLFVHVLSKVKFVVVVVVVLYCIVVVVLYCIVVVVLYCIVVVLYCIVVVTVVVDVIVGCCCYYGWL